MLLTAGAMACGYAVFYTVTTWSLAYTTEHLGMDRTVVLGCVLVAVLLKGALTPLAGLLGDRFGRRRMALAGTAAMGVVVFPYAGLLASGEPVAIAVGSAAELIAFITVFAVVGAYLPELYAPRVRCTGAALGYNLGGVLGGALTPLVATRLVAGTGTPGRWRCTSRPWHCSASGASRRCRRRGVRPRRKRRTRRRGARRSAAHPARAEEPWVRRRRAPRRASPRPPASSTP